MSESAVHFSDSSPGEQGGNGVQTGFPGRQLFEFLERVASDWKEGERLDVMVLRAICRLSVEQPERAAEGFASYDIVETVGKLRGRAWSSDDDKDQMSDDVRKYWNKLLTTWEAKEEGVIQRLADWESNWIPRLSKTEGGGAGRPSRYRVDWSSAGVGASATPSITAPPLISIEKTHVRYVCEDIQNANVLTRAFANGYFVTGWRKLLYLTLVGGPLLFLWVLLVMVAFGLTISATVGAKTAITSILSLVTAFWAVWITIGPLLQLGNHNIVRAPWWMQSIDEDRLLERRYPPRYGVKSIKAVRYVADCPICGGKLAVKAGGIEFWGRLAGRCESAPVEHMFSFDHVTRLGRSLR